jgi:D-serine deaminase-like pyridoxal phosphate-dependent protein
MYRLLRLLPLAACLTAVLAFTAVAGAAGPPVPTVFAGSAKIRALPGTACWTQKGRTSCTDAALPRPRTALPVRAGTYVTVDFGAPATGLAIDKDGRVFAKAAHVGASRGGGWARWRFRVPSGLRRPTTLMIFAFYPQGNAIFGVRIAPRR